MKHDRAAEAESATRREDRPAVRRIPDRRRNSWAALNALVMTAALVAVDPTLVSEVSPVAGLVVLTATYLVAFSFWQVVFLVLKGRFLGLTSEDVEDDRDRGPDQ